MSQIRLVIADDHPVVRAGLRTMLSTQSDLLLVGEASTGAEAVEQAVRLRPDVVLMDLRLPGLDGAAATAQIHAHGLPTAVLILTTYESTVDILRAIEAGATGYLLKDTQGEELLAAIRAVACGKAVLAPNVTTRLVHQVSKPAKSGLSTRELEVLALVAQGASNKEIARALHVSEATVKSHLLHLFGKLEVSDRTAAVTVALERKLLRLDEGTDR
ncbi:MAG TPA: response regulator transcription factor [Ktedonosporobacter sp.]|nr:response regulator transcription factor [Ktedonosporobacter sp.]